MLWGVCAPSWRIFRGCQRVAVPKRNTAVLIRQLHAVERSTSGDDKIGRQINRIGKALALPSGIEPLSPP